jgi:hypothetical protein
VPRSQVGTAYVCVRNLSDSEGFMAMKEKKIETDFTRLASADKGQKLVAVSSGPSDNDVFITVPVSISGPREVEVV